MDPKILKRIIAALREADRAYTDAAEDACRSGDIYAVYDLVGQARTVRGKANQLERRYAGNQMAD